MAIRPSESPIPTAAFARDPDAFDRSQKLSPQTAATASAIVGTWFIHVPAMNTVMASVAKISAARPKVLGLSIHGCNERFSAKVVERV